MCVCVKEPDHTVNESEVDINLAFTWNGRLGAPIVHMEVSIDLAYFSIIMLNPQDNKTNSYHQCTDKGVIDPSDFALHRFRFKTPNIFPKQKQAACTDV